MRALQVRPVLSYLRLLRSQLGACSRSQDVGCAQGVLQQLMESGTVSKLPEDLQWSIRLLVPRRAAAPAAAPAPAFAAPALSAAPLPAQAEAPALAASGVAMGQGVGSVIAQQAGSPPWPCSTSTQHAVGLSYVPACIRRRPWRSCTCYSSWLHKHPRGCRHSHCQCHRRRLPCLPAVRCARLHAHELRVCFDTAAVGRWPRLMLPRDNLQCSGWNGSGVAARQQCQLTADASTRCRQAAAAGRAGGAGAADACAAGAGTPSSAACCPPTAACLRSRSRCVRRARARACVQRSARRHVC